LFSLELGGMTAHGALHFDYPFANQRKFISVRPRE
jgi:hypothetical protein